jgi:SEC-C motif domain protein
MRDKFMENCPCGTNKSYVDCCGLYISGKQAAPTPEALMRSRYTAYSKSDIDYIQNTMRGSALTDFDKTATLAWAQRVEWLKLDVIDASERDDHGTVEFVATYRENLQTRTLHERSQFVRENGHWYYIDGKVTTQNAGKKVGRNEPCPCGSDKKFKKCCG